MNSTPPEQRAPLSTATNATHRGARARQILQAVVTCVAIGVATVNCKPNETNDRIAGGIVADGEMGVVVLAAIIGSERSVELVRKGQRTPLQLTTRDADGKVLEQCQADSSTTTWFQDHVVRVQVYDPLGAESAQRKAINADGDRFTMRVRTTMKDEDDFVVTLVREDDVLYAKPTYSKFWFTIDPVTLDALEFRCPRKRP